MAPGFYETVLAEAERVLLEAAARIEGLDGEIAVVRLRLLRQLAAGGPEGLDRADVALLIQAVKARHAISRRDEVDLTEALAETLAQFTASLGLGRSTECGVGG